VRHRARIRLNNDSKNNFLPSSDRIGAMTIQEPKSKGGRPRRFDSVAKLQEQASAYFDECDKSSEPYTWTGLALYLGFTSRQALDNYTQYDEFSETVRRAKLRCEHYAEKMALTSKNPAGPIFILKNYGWSDREQLTHLLGEEPFEFTIALPPLPG